MRRWLFLLLAALLALAAAPGAHAEPFRAGQALDQEQVAQVTAAALAFMAPRILEPVPVGQLAMWGLRSLTTLDPRLMPQIDQGHLLLIDTGGGSAHVLLDRAPPAGQDAPGWGEATAQMIRAGWNASQAVRDVRTAGLIHTFFDELCNHLDPYSRYVPPAEAMAQQQAEAGQATVGLSVGGWGQQVIVAAVQPDSPAAVAGLRPGEAVLAVDGEPVDAEDPDLVQDSLTGPPDSAVALTVRQHSGRVRRLRLTRAVLPSRTVQARRMGGVLALRITGFAADTGQLLGEAITHGLAGAAGRGVRGLVLDLRDNRGGVLDQAAAAAGTLQPAGLVATTQGRDPEADHVFRADGDDRANGLPVVVLVDGRTASAAEILAAALADQRRAVVVGSATLGKGLVQTILPLPDGGALYVTWSRVLAPLGWPIQGLGVLPQVCTSQGHEAAEAQLQALQDGRQEMAAALERERGARPPVAPETAIEIRSACPAAAGSELDERAAAFLVAHPAAYETALLEPEVSR